MKENMRKVQVLLNSIDSVKKFVYLTNQQSMDIYVQSGNYVMNAKSILDIFSLNLLRPLTIWAECSYEEFSGYCVSIEKFIYRPEKQERQICTRIYLPKCKCACI